MSLPYEIYNTKIMIEKKLKIAYNWLSNKLNY